MVGKRPAAEVQRPELVDLVRKIERREAFNVARKVRQWLSQIFRFGLAKGVVPGNRSWSRTRLEVSPGYA